MASSLLLFAWLFFAKDVLGGYLDVTPKYLVARVGDSVSVMCQAAEALTFCRLVPPYERQGAGLILIPGNKLGDISYEGLGWEKGQCGFRISPVQEMHNGVFVCFTANKRDPQESSANITLVVAKSPAQPKLTVEPNSVYYKEGDSIVAKCVVGNGRPVANISWYIGDQRVTDGLMQPVQYAIAAGDLHTIEQNLTRALQANDNGKSLRCVAQHPLLSDRHNSTVFQINVRFPPKPLPDPIEHFGLVEGEEGNVAVVVHANPKPTFIWQIGAITLTDGESNDRFSVKHSTAAGDKGPSHWESVLVINPLVKEDTERNYVLVASNSLGEEKYKINISTSPEPKTADLHAGTIALIVIAVVIVLILTVILLIARAKGRWCFAGQSGVHITGESSDTESADHHQVAKSKLAFKSVFKKKSDKVAADAPATKDVTVNDEKADNVEAAEDGQVTLNPKNEEGVVYAELDLHNAPQSRGLLVRPENDKTEYAEIIHTKEK